MAREPGHTGVRMPMRRSRDARLQPDAIRRTYTRCAAIRRAYTRCAAAVADAQCTLRADGKAPRRTCGI